MLIKVAEEKSAQIKGRVERFGFIAIDQGRRKTAAGRFLFEVAHVGMVPMQLVDKMVTIIGWNASYETAIGWGYTEESAVEYADWVVDQTQQANHPKAVAGAYRNPNSLLRTLLMFTGPSNKLFNQLTYGNTVAIKKGLKGDYRGYLQSAAITVGIGTSMLFFWSIGHGGLPEDDEEWWQALGGGTLELMPLFGPSLSALLKGYNQTQAPAQQVLGLGADVVLSVAKAANANTEKKRNQQLGWAFSSGFEALGLTTGMPVTMPVRIVRTASNGNLGELIGWRDNGK